MGGIRQLKLPFCLTEQLVVEGDMLAMMQVKNPVFPAKLLPENGGKNTKYASLELHEKANVGREPMKPELRLRTVK